MADIVYDVKKHYSEYELDDVAICKTLTGAKTVAQDDTREYPGYEDVTLCWEFDSEYKHWKAQYGGLEYTIHRVEVLP